MDSPNPLLAGLRGRCPNCGEGRLFQGFLTVAPACAYEQPYQQGWSAAPTQVWYQRPAPPRGWQPPPPRWGWQQPQPRWGWQAPPARWAGPPPSRGWGGPPPRYAYHHHGGPGAGPFIAGALLGLGTAAVIAGTMQPAPVYAAPPVVYAPPPPPAVVYAAPPPAVVYSVGLPCPVSLSRMRVNAPYAPARLPNCAAVSCTV